jgi:hypothetical protein
MSAKYVIRWTSKVNGRAGRGTREFSREEGERLVAELNAEYPDIEHELVVAPPPRTESSGQSEETESGKQSSTVQAVSFE